MFYCLIYGRVTLQTIIDLIRELFPAVCTEYFCQLFFCQLMLFNSGRESLKVFFTFSGMLLSMDNDGFDLRLGFCRSG